MAQEIGRLDKPSAESRAKQIETLAREIYSHYCVVAISVGKTKEHLAATALEDAKLFYEESDKRGGR